MSLAPVASDSASTATLQEVRHELQELRKVPGVGAKALGVPTLDWQLWSWGRELLAASEKTGSRPACDGPDVYLATEVYAHGGHTVLIGDFVQALGKGRDSHLVVTDLHGGHTGGVKTEVQIRTGIPPAHIHVLGGTTLGEKLALLWEQLRILRPGRLFLFHHADDPLPCVVAQPSLVGQTVLVHHADSIPAFGLHIPGITLIELNPVAASMSRLLGLEPCLLPLTCPDPGPRPERFLQRGRLVTASCGSQSKYTTPYAYDYPGTVGVILRATQGWHVHIGALDETLLEKTSEALRRQDVPRERFVHVPWVPSLARALWEHGCDVYISSFPIDGARVNAEVMASGTPHLRHTTRSSASPNMEMSLRGGLTWKTWEDLAALLPTLEDASLLEEKSCLLRSAYNEMHHPHRFAEKLEDILAGRDGHADLHQAARDQWLVQGMVKTLSATLLQVNRDLRHQRGRIDTLKQEKQALQDKLSAVEQALSPKDTRPSGLRARLRRWLMHP